MHLCGVKRSQEARQATVAFIPQVTYCSQASDIPFPKPLSRSHVAPQEHTILLSCVYQYSDCVCTMATPPAERAAATRNDFDGVGDDGRSDEAAPDGGYGWVCVAACFTVNCFTWGTVSVSRRCVERLVEATPNDKRSHLNKLYLC